jgi:hypothetical protein
MQLSDFLQTASPDHVQAVIEAHAYTTTTGHMLDATSVNGYLSAFKLLGVVKNIAENHPTHSAYETLLAVWVALQGNHPFNFKMGNIVGDGNIAALNRLIDVDLTEHAPALRMFRDTVLYYANTVTYPFAGITLHDVLLSRNACPILPVTQRNGYVVVTTTQVCERHSPRLLALNPRTEQYERIGNFMNIAKAGAYECLVLPVHRDSLLFVDDVYGVIAPSEAE